LLQKRRANQHANRLRAWSGARLDVAARRDRTPKNSPAARNIPQRRGTGVRRNLSPMTPEGSVNEAAPAASILLPRRHAGLPPAQGVVMQMSHSIRVHRVEGSHNLTDQCRGEFLEMPGMRLTLRQATRLWCADLVTCEAALDALVASGFLRRVGQLYIRADTGRENA
jgi:hypothetical protein